MIDKLAKKILFHDLWLVLAVLLLIFTNRGGEILKTHKRRIFTILARILLVVIAFWLLTKSMSELPIPLMYGGDCSTVTC